MKFNPFNWQEIEIGQEHESKTGRLRLMCSQEAALYVSAQGYEVLAGTGKTVSIDTQERVKFYVEAPEGARVFVERQANTFHRPTGEVFTNLDRKPDESGSMLEISAALRQMKLQQRQMVLAMKQERLALRAERTSQTGTEPVPEPEVRIEHEPENTEPEDATE